MHKINLFQRWHRNGEKNAPGFTQLIEGTLALAPVHGAMFAFFSPLSDHGLFAWFVFGAVIWVPVSALLYDGMQSYLDGPKTRAFKNLERELAKAAAAFVGKFPDLWKISNDQHYKHRSASNGVHLTFHQGTRENLTGLFVAVAVDGSTEMLHYFLHPTKAPVLTSYTWTITFDTTHYALPHDRVKDLKLRLTDALTEIITGVAPAPASAATPVQQKTGPQDALSGLTDLSALKGEGQAPWFNALVDRVQGAALHLTKVVDLKAAAADDLTRNLAPQLAAMLTAAHPIVQDTDDGLFPELRAALEALTTRMETYNKLARQNTAAQLTRQAEQVLQVSETLPDPVLR